MANLSIDARSTLQFACRRHIVQLFKSFLEVGETLAMEHDESLAKLATALPAQYTTYLSLADYLTDERSDRLRREVLQRGNDCVRSIQEEIAKYEIEFAGRPTPAPVPSSP